MRQAEAPACLSQVAVFTAAPCPAYQLGLGWSYEPVIEKLILNSPSLIEKLTVTNTLGNWRDGSVAKRVAALPED